MWLHALLHPALHRRHAGEEDDLMPSAPQEEQADEEEEDLSDEAIALRLQQEELAAQNARFMQMAGIGMCMVQVDHSSSIQPTELQQPGEELDAAASLSNSEHLSYEVGRCQSFTQIEAPTLSSNNRH